MNPIQIIATIGPVSKDIEVMRGMIEAGMSLARLNFSWGTHEEHRQFVADIRKASAEMGKGVPVIQDLSGPRIQRGDRHTFDTEVKVLTKKDCTDIKVMADLQVEYIAISFVKDSSDIVELRHFLTDNKLNSKIIAKIERQEAVDNLSEIISVADGIMIARGDLGDSVAVEKLPFIKKSILDQCQKADTPAIVATEMLTSMIDETDPSRADVSDIAQAVLDGASATMLSNETAIGNHPVKTVSVMRRVVDEAQRHTTKAVAHF